MEELQDAIEDAQYVNAMSDEGPKPSKEWPYPPIATLEAWVSTKPPSTFTLSSLLKSPMPLYMFSRFCKEEAPTNASAMMFVEDICRYRRLYGDAARSKQSEYILENYGGGVVEVVDMVESEMQRDPKVVMEEDVAKGEDLFGRRGEELFYC